MKNLEMRDSDFKQVFRAKRYFAMYNSWSVPGMRPETVKKARGTF